MLLVCVRSCLKNQFWYTFLIFDTCHPDTVFTWTTVWRWLVVFRNQRGPRAKRFWKYWANPFVGKAINGYITGMNESGRLERNLVHIGQTKYQHCFRHFDTNCPVFCAGFIARASHFFMAGPHPLLWTGSRDARENITVSGTLNRLNNCVIFILHTQFADVAAGRMRPDDRSLETHVLQYIET